jgi:glycosyltransferase involved in cell wall biosynthesis
MMQDDRPAVAVVLWGILEDWLDPLGISFEAFCREFTGSYVFGYADALGRSGVRAILIYVSCRITSPVRCIHGPTGATICILPAPRIYRAVRRRVRHPRARSVRAMFGPLTGFRRLLFPGLAVLRETILYLETPIQGLLKEIRREKCVAILCQEYEYPRFDVCTALGRMLRLPVFATFQGGDYQRCRLEAYLRPITLRACTGLIIASQAEANRVQARYGVSRAKIAPIANPIDPAVWRPLDQKAVRAKLGIPPAARVIVWHGRVSIRHKGLDILLDAWRQLCTHPADLDLRMILVGSGQDAEELRRMIADTGGDSILWIEHFLQDRAAVREYLAAGDVYAFPSRHEGFPVAPIEAMFCGLPIVAADARGVADILPDGEASGGVVVPRDDSTALTHALRRFVEDDQWCREMGHRARQNVLTRYSTETVGRQLRVVLCQQQQRGARANRLDATGTSPS